MMRFVKIASKFKALYTGKYAVVTNTITAGSLGCLADTVAQTIEIQQSSTERIWDFDRSKNMTIISGGFGPLVYYWYRFLDNKFPGKNAKALSSKVFLDLLIAPIWYGVFIGGLCLLKNCSLESSVKEYKEKAPVLISLDLLVWPILQSFNFFFFPPYYRIIGLKFNEIIMGIFASHVLNNNYSINVIKEKFFPKTNQPCKDK